MADLRTHMTGVGPLDNRTTHQWLLVAGRLVSTNLTNLTDLVLTVASPKDNQSQSLLTNVKVSTESNKNNDLWIRSSGICEYE